MRTQFRIIKVIAAVLWLSIIWGIRGVSDDVRVVFVLGFAPDFCAAIALFFDALDRNFGEDGERVSRTRVRLTVAIGVIVLLFVGELLQEYVFWGSLDRWDIAAHFAGAVSAYGLSELLLRLHHRTPKGHPR
ncbi:MAG: hypothetical protein AAFX06_25555 [Planctomycetota bacterium]